MKDKMGYFKVIEKESDRAMLSYKKSKKDVLSWHDGMAQFIRDEILQKDINVSIDIGASYGWFALPFASYSKEVYCFEMRKDVFECLKTNISKYDNIHCYNKALSSKNDKVYYNIEDKDISGMTNIVKGEMYKYFEDLGYKIFDVWHRDLIFVPNNFKMK